MNFKQILILSLIMGFSTAKLCENLSDSCNLCVATFPKCTFVLFKDSTSGMCLLSTEIKVLTNLKMKASSPTECTYVGKILKRQQAKLQQKLRDESAYAVDTPTSVVLLQSPQSTTASNSTTPISNDNVIHSNNGSSLDRTTTKTPLIMKVLTTTDTSFKSLSVLSTPSRIPGNNFSKDSLPSFLQFPIGIPGANTNPIESPITESSEPVTSTTRNEASIIESPVPVTPTTGNDSSSTESPEPVTSTTVNEASIIESPEPVTPTTGNDSSSTESIQPFTSTTVNEVTISEPVTSTTEDSIIESPEPVTSTTEASTIEFPVPYISSTNVNEPSITESPVQHNSSTKVNEAFISESAMQNISSKLDNQPASTTTDITVLEDKNETQLSAQTTTRPDIDYAISAKNDSMQRECPSVVYMPLLPRIHEGKEVTTKNFVYWESSTRQLFETVQVPFRCRNATEENDVEAYMRTLCNQISLGRKLKGKLDKKTAAILELNPAKEFKVVCKALSFQRKNCYKKVKRTILKADWQDEISIASKLFFRVDNLMRCQSWVKKEPLHVKLARVFCESAVYANRIRDEIVNHIDVTYMMLLPSWQNAYKCQIAFYRDYYCY